MIVNIDIVLTLKDKFDYSEYENRCTEKGVTPLPIGEYAQKIGMLCVAIARFKGVPAIDAYLQFITEMNQPKTEIVIEPSIKNGPSPCGGCGGGKVR